MSDEPIKPPEGFVPVAPGGVQAHRCEHDGCGKWGGFGFARPRQTPHWFCFGHRGGGERYL